jgi:hypothetical protein
MEDERRVESYTSGYENGMFDAATITALLGMPALGR